MTISTSVYVPDATLYSSYSSNLVLDIQKSLYTMNSSIATFTNGLITQDVFANRPAPGTSGRFFYATDTGKFYYDNGTSWVSVSTGFLGVTIFTTGSGTFTTNKKTSLARIRATAGGGAGGGAATTGAAAISVGSGGGAGGSVELWCTPGATESYSIGTGGTGVSGGTGNSGTNTTFGSWITCVGGSGGIVNTATTTQYVFFAQGSSGYETGTGGTRVRMYGLNTNPPIVMNGSALSGAGAGSLWGPGAWAITSSGNGGNATSTQYGTGGSGALNLASQGVARTGGSGADGVIVIEEFG